MTIGTATKMIRKTKTYRSMLLMTKTMAVLKKCTPTFEKAIKEHGTIFAMTVMISKLTISFLPGMCWSTVPLIRVKPENDVLFRQSFTATMSHTLS